MQFLSLITTALALSSSAFSLSLTDILGNSTLSSLQGAVVQQNLSSAVSGLKTSTIFAPVNSAFAAVDLSKASSTDITNILTYHVISGTEFTPTSSTPNRYFLTPLLANSTVRADINGSSVTVFSSNLKPANVIYSAKTDDGSNVVVHFIDSVLVPPQRASVVATTAGLSQLLAALNATNLASVVDGLNRVTILAPTDAAFKSIADVVKTLTTDQISAILKLHIIPNPVYSTDLLKAGPSLSNIATLNTQNNLTEFNNATGVYFSGPGNKTPATVLITDVLVAGNSVVHVIDTVLLPGAAGFTNGTSTIGFSSGALSVLTLNSVVLVGFGLIGVLVSMF